MDTNAHGIHRYSCKHTPYTHHTLKESYDSFGVEPTPLLSRKLGFSGAFGTSDPQRPSGLALGRPRVPLRSHAAVRNSTFRRHAFARELDVDLGDTQRLYDRITYPQAASQITCRISWNNEFHFGSSIFFIFFSQDLFGVEWLDLSSSVEFCQYLSHMIFDPAVIGLQIMGRADPRCGKYLEMVKCL